MIEYMEVRLEPFELALSTPVGCRRYMSALYKGLKDGHGLDPEVDGWAIHIEGAAGELAFAKATNRYWSGSVDTFKRGGDVGLFQVKTRSKHKYDLLVRPGDKDDDTFVLVTGQIPVFRVRGWCLGWEAKLAKFSQTHGDRPAAFFVPVDQLRDVKELCR